MITDIQLQNFRSYKNSSFDLNEGVNIIVGPNASGKTNLLEGILYISQGKSYRAGDIDIIKHGEEAARIEAHTTTNDIRIARIENTDGKVEKQFKINSQSFQRLSIQKTIPVVLFEPTHLRLLSGSPEQRRLFMDDLLQQLNSGYGTIRRQYKRVLAQRNALLKKTHGQAVNELFAWNIRLSELGEQITHQRVGLIQDMNNQATDVYNKLAPAPKKKIIQLEYNNNVISPNFATEMLKKLEGDIDKDIERGYTTYGPHREDLSVYIDKHQAMDTASRGETRTILLMLKMLEVNLIESTRLTKPILLLDDVFSELDGARRQALTLFLKSYQAFITTTDADLVIQYFTKLAKIIPT